MSVKPKKGNINCYRFQTCLLAVILVMLALALDSSASLNVRSDRAMLKPNDLANFTITVSNSGETLLDPVRMVDTLPPGMSYVSDDRSGIVHGDEILWSNLGRLNTSESTPVHLATRIGPFARGTLENRVTVTGTPPTGYNVSDNDTEDVFVTLAAKKTNGGNLDHIELGGQKAMAFGPSSQAKNAATSNNYDEIMKAQSGNQGGCCGHNLIYIQAGNQSALAYGSAVAINKRAISTAQN